MFEVTGLWDGMQSEGVGHGPHIHLRVDHPNWQQAARLLEVLGGRRFLPAAGTVYRFLTTSARDQALQLVRSKVGWTVAAAFDGRPWRPDESKARWVEPPNSAPLTTVRTGDRDHPTIDQPSRVAAVVRSTLPLKTHAEPSQACLCGDWLLGPRQRLRRSSFPPIAWHFYAKTERPSSRSRRARATQRAWLTAAVASVIQMVRWL